MKEQEEVLKWEAENDLIWVDEFEFDLENIDKARVPWAVSSPTSFLRPGQPQIKRTLTILLPSYFLKTIHLPKRI